jgi:hypothetical protein
MKRTLALIGAAFAVALAVVIGSRMSADAMAVVVGVVCGVLASIPTSLLLIWALGRRGYGAGAGAEGQARNNPGTHYPPVVVVNPGPGYGMPAYGPSPVLPLDRSLPPPGSPRTFKVVGDEETMLDELRHTFPGLAEDWVEGN